MPQPTRRRSLWFASLLALCCCVAIPDAARAHGQPVELEFWGGYGPGVARCQRAIARSSARCMGDVVAARQACLTPALNGPPCDTQQLSATIAALRQRALDMVAPSCAPLQLQQLRYMDISDAYRDIVDACRRLDTALASAAYAPAMRGGAVNVVPDPTRSCVVVTATATAKLLDFSVRARQRAFDRIASTQLAPAEKQHLVARGGAQIARVANELRAQMSAGCAPADFSAAYNRDMDTYLAGVVAQGGCHAQYVYVQNAVVCPVIECGNGIQEPNEQCDDGNTVEDDGCRSDCTRGECPACAP